VVNLPALILAGGVGEKIKLLTGGRPKTLLEIAGKRLIEYVLANVRKMGVSRAIIVVNEPKEYEDIVVKYSKYFEINLVKQKLPEIERAILSTKDFIQGDFMLLYEDIVAPVDTYRELLSLYLSGNYGIVLVPEEDLET